MMKGRKYIVVLGLMCGFFLNPQTLLAQGLANDMNSLHAVLEKLYDEMIPLCSQMIGVAQGIAGFAAIWYIGSRVWRHIANAEPVDFYPLFRPFVLGFAIFIFPLVLALINGIMQPTVVATSSMLKGSNQAIANLLKLKENSIKNSNAWQMYVGSTGEGDRERWYKYTYDEPIDDEGVLEGIGNDMRFYMAKQSFAFKNSIKEWMSEVLRVIYEAAALCINTLRTFNLIVLGILGPLVFGIAIFDGFQHTLTSWIARYINTFLWLPVSNIFGSIIGKIQEQMLALDISQIEQEGSTFFSSTDVAYLVFMIIGIVGYFTVPTVAGYIVNAGGGGAFVQKVTTLLSSSTQNTSQIIQSGVSHVSHGLSNIMGSSSNHKGQSESSNTGAFLHSKLKGN